MENIIYNFGSINLIHNEVNVIINTENKENLPILAGKAKNNKKVVDEKQLEKKHQQKCADRMATLEAKVN